MPSPLEVARDHYATRSRLVTAVAAEAGRLWSQVDPGSISSSWLALLARLFLILVGAQQAAAGRANSYLDEVLDAQGINPRAEGRVEAAALAGVASDGRDLTELLYQPAVTTLVGVSKGATVDRALASGRATLDMIVRTQVADAGRVADEVATTARLLADGYVRMLVGRSCSRCAILAGRWYPYNAGFSRHPRCDCVGIPGREDTTDDLRTDPKAYFRSLSAAEQDRIFTKAGAEAIRLGADIAQVVNVRRGASGLATASRATAAEVRVLRGGRTRGWLERAEVFGRQLAVTTEGTTVRGLARQRLGARSPRLMPEAILQIAGGDRDEALRLLKRNGFIL